MPIYEYRCEACGQQEEKLQSFSAPDAHDCPECEVPGGMKRQLSAAAFSLSGGGWYAQGYGAGKGDSDAAPKEASKPAAPLGGCAGGCACH